MVHPRSPWIVAMAACCSACSLNTSGIEDNPWTSASSTTVSASEGTGVGGSASSFVGSGGASVTATTGPGAGGAGGAGGKAASAGSGGASDCADGVEDPATKHCYLYAQSASWSDARIECQTSFKGDLAAVASLEELTFVLSAFGDKTDMYIGGIDEMGDGVWTWVNGEIWGVNGWGKTDHVLPWKSDEPNNLATETVIKLHNAVFETAQPDPAKAYLCERAP